MRSIVTSCYPSVPVQDQLHLNSCAGHVCRELAACVGVDVSAMWAYYIGRMADGNSELEDTGVPLSTLLKAVNRHGVVSEAAWPFRADMVSRHPPTEVVPEKGQIEFFPIQAQRLKARLNADQPVACVVEMSDSFERFIVNSAHDHQVFRGAPPDDVSSFGHAMVLTGFIPYLAGKQGAYMARSSWGKGFGQCGTVYLPASFIHDPTRVEQFYVARRPSPLRGLEALP